MRDRMLIVAVGVLLGFACKWVFGEPESSREHRSPTPPRKSPDADANSRIEETSTDDSANFDALIPPAKLPGDLIASAGGNLHGAIPGFDEAGGPLLTQLLADEMAHDERAIFEAHGDEVCASGCAVSRHPTKKLEFANFEELLEKFAEDPISDKSLAYETLLYYGRQTREHLAKFGFGNLDSERRLALSHELSRAHARISIRVVDEFDQVRSSLPPTRVPLDRRHVFSMDVNQLQPLVTSGTVKRVGVDRLWVRL